jgi:hypothetical protein
MFLRAVALARIGHLPEAKESAEAACKQSGEAALSADMRVLLVQWKLCGG